MSEFVLYSYFRSSASYRVRIALNLKGVSYEYRPVHLVNNGGEQNSESYRSLNPSGEVPTLIHNDFTLTQSVAIIDYLDRVAPTPRLFPDDARQRANVLVACEVVNSGIQPIQNLKVLKELERRAGFDQIKKNEWAAHWIREGLAALEVRLKSTAGRYCFGDTVTAADCFLIPQIFNAERFGVDLSEMPTLSRINRSCLEIDAFQKAGIEFQPDTPPELRK